MKWFTHILWNTAAAAALCSIFAMSCDTYITVSAMAALHTVVTDVLGHRGLRRNRYHDAISLITAVVLTASVGNPVLLIFGPIHIVLDRLSPGRLAVSWAYNIMWSLVAVFILSRFITVA